MTSYLGSERWKPSTLQDLVTLQRGFDITKAEQKEGEVPVISSSGISSWHDEAMVEGPGVIIGRKGSLGTVHYSENAYWPHDTTLWSKSLHSNNPRFVYYALQVLNLERFNVGGANPTLNRNHIHGLPIFLPDRSTQDEIARILTAYDDLIKNNRRRIGLLEGAARLLYREWFVHFRFPGHEHVKITNGLPEGWRLGRVADFYDTSSGGTPSRKNPRYFEGQIPWIKTQELENSFIIKADECISEDGLRNSSAKVFPSQTLLIAMYGATVGQLGILAIPSACNQACCAVIPRNESANFIHSFLFFMENKERLRDLSAGAAQRNINQDVIKSLPMSLPSDNLMSLLVETASPRFDLWLNLQQQNRQLKEARDRLLPRLMSGEIAV